MSTLARLIGAASLGAEIGDTSITARTQVAVLERGQLIVPHGTRYVLVEAGCSDMDTLLQDLLPLHPDAFSVSFEPMLDKYSYLVGNASAEFHGPEARDETVPLAHANPRGIVLPLAISARGGLHSFAVSPIAGCSSLADVNPNGTWANQRCRTVTERRLVDSLTVADVLALVPEALPILRFKLDIQGVELDVLRTLSPPTLLRSRVVYVDLEVRRPGPRCPPLYHGQPACDEVLTFMHESGFDLVVPHFEGEPKRVNACSDIHYDNKCEANAHFRSRTLAHLASRLPLPYKLDRRKTFRGSPQTDEEHG